jgi:hypothetical protein
MRANNQFYTQQILVLIIMNENLYANIYIFKF